MTWALWITAIVLAGAGLTLLVFAVRGDRPRGRRRCPRCWYDASGLNSLTCPECGHHARTERAMLRTRRRPWHIVASLVLILGSIASASVPFFLDPSWHSKAPLVVLSAAVLIADDSNDRLLGELQVRAGPDLAKLSGPGRWLHARRLARVLAREVRVGGGVGTNTLRGDRMLQTLSAMGPAASGAVPVFRRMLGDEREHVRYCGAATLALTRDSAAGAALALARAAEHDPSTACRSAAIRTLGKIGPKAIKAIPALERVARGTDDRAAAMAIQAIDRIGDAPEHLLAELLASAGEVARVECARALGRRRERAVAATDMLLDGMRSDPSANARHECMSALRSVNPGHPGYAEALAHAIGDENRGIRFGAVQNLEAIAASQTIDHAPFLDALDDADLSVRFAAAQSMSRLWPAQAAGVRGAAAMLTERDHSVRLWGVQQLREWGSASASALPALRPLRWDEYEPLRAEAAAAIRAIERGEK